MATPSASPGRNFQQIRDSLPDGVALLVAAKGRSPEELAEVLQAGATLVGENYVQEAEGHLARLGQAARAAEWHLIGHLQRNKVARALVVFDAVQSVDSLGLARALDARAERPLPVLVEVNIGGEGSKFGVPPEGVEGLVQQMAGLPNLRVEGLMTMEPYLPDPEEARPYFRRMRELFERVRGLDLPGAPVRTLSMGMTHSYRVAVEEGATMVRVGTAIFGPRA